MVTKWLDFTDFSLDPKLGLKDYSVIHFKNGIPLKFFLANKCIETDIKSGRTPSKFNEDYWNGDYDFLTMQDVNTLTFEVGNVTEKITDYAIEEEKTLYQTPANSLIISNAMTVGLAFISENPIYINQNVFHLKINEDSLNKTFIKWYFNLIFRPNFESVFVSKYFSKDEFGRLRIPKLSISLQNKIALKIMPIENEIKTLEHQIKEPSHIINAVFASELKFDLVKYSEAVASSIFKLNLSDFENSLIRIAICYNHPSSSYIREFVSKKNFERINKYCLTEIHRGKQPEYVEDGIKVIKTGTIQKGGFNYTEVQYVSEQFYENNIIKAGIQKNDLLLTSTGMGRGKFALYEEDDEAFADSHVTIFRLDNSVINPQFLNYFAQSILGTGQLKYLELQIKGTPEIYPTQLNEFMIPIVKEKKQSEIVNKIKAELDSQKEIEKQILNKRNKIKQIIEEAISSN